MKTCTRCGEQNNRKKSEFCSTICANADWHDRNKEKVAARMKTYKKHKSEVRKPSPGWEARRQAIIERYGVTRQWLRKVEKNQNAREVL